MTKSITTVNMTAALNCTPTELPDAAMAASAIGYSTAGNPEPRPSINATDRPSLVSTSLMRPRSRANVLGVFGRGSPARRSTLALVTRVGRTEELTATNAVIARMTRPIAI